MINQKKSVTQLCFFEIHHNISDCIISIKLISEKCMEGGLLNEKGQVIGINTAKTSTTNLIIFFPFIFPKTGSIVELISPILPLLY